MSYEIRIHPKAIKELQNTPDRFQATIKKKLKVLSSEFGKPKSKLDIRKMKGTKKKVELYRLRVGDYRIVFEFSDDIIWVARISHKKDAYRGL